jgi:transposase
MPALAIRNDIGSEELRRRARRERDGRISARLIAIANALEGMDRVSAARLAGMDRQTLRDWVHRYNAEGIAGLCNRPAPGRKPKLTEGQMATLKAVVLAGPDPAVDKIARWRIVDLCRWVEERWGVSYSETGMLRLLWSLDLSHRKTRPRHPQSSEKAQRAFKKRGLLLACRKSRRHIRKPSGLNSGARTRRGSGKRGGPAMSGGSAAIPRAGCAMSATSPLGSSAPYARHATPVWPW